MNEERHDNDVVDDRPYSRRWVVRGAAAFTVAAGIGSLGLVRWAAAKDDDEKEDRDSLDDSDDEKDDYGDDRGDDHDDHDDRDDKDDDEYATAGSESTAGPDEHRVEIRDEQFIPATITIEAGEWVTWVNFDDDEHTATGEDFDTGKLDTGARGEVQFNTPGSYRYTCQFHPEMHGEVIVLGGAATPQASPEASPIASPEASPQASPAAGGGQERVTIVDFAFEPQTLTVPVGTTVVWTNTGNAPHTVTGGPLDSGALRSGDTFQFTFTKAETVNYLCEFHPQMTATIEVTG